MKSLFDKITIKDVELRNRIVMAPMCMYSADEDGYANDWHFSHYETRSIGGVGLIMVEATAVEKRGRISENDLGIWDDSHIPGLSEIVRRVHRHGGKIGIQLAHAGRKSTVKSDDIIAPSSINFDESDSSYVIPREMSQYDIETVINSFKEGARRALEAGFDIIEIHGAHGYLINEFLSPLTNTRTDNYSTAHKNGGYFLECILKKVRTQWDYSKPMFIRISAIDYHENGNKPEDLSYALSYAKDYIIDFVNVSSGGVIPKPVPSFEGYQIKFAETIKRKTGINVIAGGKIKSAHMADEIIKNERAEMVYLGRQLLIQPYWPITAAAELKVDIDYTPFQYLRWK